MGNSQMPVISIVTISFNQVAFLRECIDSVVSQMDHEIEYIVVDPGSTDGSRELIKSYGDKLTYCFEKDKGPADGLNNGFNIAKGKYFYFLNSDDLLLDGAIAAMKKAISKYDDDVYCFQGYMVDKNLNYLRLMRTFKFSAKRFCRGSTSLFQQGLLFSSSKFRYVGGFDINNRTCWDARLMFDFAMKGCSFRDLPEKIGLFRIYDESITGSATNLIENSANKDAMFEEVFKRKKSLMDRALYNIYRFEKYCYISYTLQTLKLFKGK